MRAAARDDAMRNNDILLERTRGRMNEQERMDSMYNRRYLSWKILFSYFYIFHLYFIPVDNLFYEMQESM